MRRLVLIVCGVLALAWAWQVGHLTLAVKAEATRPELNQPVDVIVVLGAAEYRGKPSPVLRARLDHALDLYRRQLAPNLLTTGGAGGDPIHTEAEVGRSYLADKGIPIERIYIEREGATTAQSIAASAEIFKRLGWKSCILVSDNYHLLRARRMMEDHGLSCYGSARPTRDSDSLAAYWLYFRQAVGLSLYQLGLRY